MSVNLSKILHVNVTSAKSREYARSFQGLTFRKKSWGHLASKFSFLVTRTSILVAKNYLQEKIEYNTLKV